MLIEVIATLFKYKIATCVIVLACWPAFDQVKFARKFARHDLQVTFSCDLSALNHVHPHRFQGVLKLQSTNISLDQINTKHFSHWYKWVIVGDIDSNRHRYRYDADMVLLTAEEVTTDMKNSVNGSTFLMKDIHIDPSKGLSLHPWAHWTEGLQVTHDRQRILRRLNLNLHPLRIATPMGTYSEDTYNGTFKDYVLDISTPERDPGIRVTYGASALIVEALNATEVLIGTELWSTEINNNSMLLMLSLERAELAGGMLRILHNRIKRLDYATYLWPFRVGFTYLAERESSSNMFVEPFTGAVWWSSLALAVLLALAQRLMARSALEKEGAYMAVLATYLQQDASAIPEGISGRVTFIVMSVSAMLIHAYYTSAIVSDLMSTGRSGPDTLTSLADSRYAIASEDYDYMRYLMFDVETNRNDLEYLKKKKKNSKFYQYIDRGVQLIQEGNTAYHTEYNQLYPRLKFFTDDQLCKLQYVDTIPETMTWITTNKRGQWLDVFRSTGGWLHETGLTKRLVSRLRINPPPCRSALLAERVKFGDVRPVILVSLLGAVLSFIQLGVEILFSQRLRKKMTVTSETSDVVVEDIEEGKFVGDEISITSY